MNERIFELAKQADLIQWDSLPSGARTPDHESVVKAQKFAELIVKECMDCSSWVGKVNKNAKEPVHTAHAINQRIKKHFGVEE